MKVLIAEKPSVARSLAAIVGATDKKEGYLEGNGYAVTWAFGHLVTLAMPEVYGIRGFQRDNLPILPPVFQLVPRQVKTDKGYKPDSGALAQLKIIKKLFDSCDRIIVCTDSGREGEAIFRYIYEYLGCAKPFDRLWISSLTDKAIRDGLANLKCGAEYDNLYYAARARSQADWIVGLNSTSAVTIAAGRGTYSLGRVQTPTLAMVCSRYLENKHFVPQKFWQMSLSLNEQNHITQLASVDKWFDKEEAERVYGQVKVNERATVEKMERKKTTQEPPLLFDLTTLQKEANTKHGFSADTTLTIAQKLYESGVLTYPRTGSRYISEDVLAEIYPLISSLWEHPLFAKQAIALSNQELNRRSVDGKKVTDHHALLITENKPKGLTDNETTIYNMVMARMLEAFSKKCVKDVTTVTVVCGDTRFTLKGSIVKQIGWRGVLNEKDEKEDAGTIIPDWTEGLTLSVGGCSLAESQTKAKPLHTEATLLGSMETCGKNLESEELKDAMRECGIGTPATRASIIETLFTREYMVRSKKSLVPTEKGLAIYSIVKDMKIADVEMTGQWEAALAKIEKGEMKDDTFHKGIEVYATQITSELLASKILYTGSGQEVDCPKCGSGKMSFFPKVVKCNNSGCELPIFRTLAGKQLSDAQITELITSRKTGVIKGFQSKAGKSFDASLAFDESYKVVFVFPEKKKRK